MKTKLNFVAVLMVLISLFYFVIAVAEAPGRWRKVVSGLNDQLIQTVVIDPKNSSTLFAGTAIGAFRSNDRGNTWDALDIGLTDTIIFSVDCIAIDPYNTSIIYLGVLQKGIFKSQDGGNTWRAMNTGLPDLDIKALAIDPLNTSVVYAGTSRGMFRSEDGGNTWSNVNMSPFTARIQALVVDPKNSLNIFAGIWGRGIFNSADGGKTWRAMNTGLSDRWVSDLIIDPKNSLILYTALRGGVFTTSNGGSTWNSINVGLTDLNVSFLAIDEQYSSSLYAGNSEGLFRWITAGTQTILVFTIEEREYLVDGLIQYMDIEPLIIEGRTMLPIRFVAEPLGAKISWDSASQKVTVSLDSTTLELWINNPKTRINGKEIFIDPENPQVMPILKEGRTLLPLRFVSESLGADVKWNTKLRTVSISHIATR